MQNMGSPKKALLGELESIIDILDDSDPIDNKLFNDLDKHAESLQTIPVLDDVVADTHGTPATTLEASPSLLDLDRIFSDDEFPPRLNNDTINNEESNYGGSDNKACDEVEQPQDSNISRSEEEQSDMFPILEDSVTATINTLSNHSITPANDARSSNFNQDLNLLIQELVDEFIPELETRLREQLTELAPEVIRNLAEKHLNN